MTKVCFFSSVFINNECFNLESSCNRDNFLYFLYDLKMAFYDVGYDLATHDINTCFESEFVIQLGLDVECPFSDQKKYLILLESPHVDVLMFDDALHASFEKIFTWNDKLVDNKKYFKINYSFNPIKSIPKKWNKDLCCMISGNKFSTHPMELYSERVKLLDWYQDYHPNKIDLYGTQWDEFYFGGSLIGRMVNKIPIFKKSKFSFYRGTVESKIDTLRKYKFSVCYENIKNQEGYITEKIFDSFFSGCVPIYWGASNIKSYIPKDCFIDKREFENFEELYSFINNMDKPTYMGYLNSIDSFVSGKKFSPFSVKTFSSLIVKETVKNP